MRIYYLYMVTANRNEIVAGWGCYRNKIGAFPDWPVNGGELSVSCPLFPDRLCKV